MKNIAWLERLDRLAVSVIVTAAIFGFTSMPASARVVAFPGAEGFGRWAVGGRGGAVYKVTNLKDSGSGSLRWAINASGPRTVVFDVSGTIHLDSPLWIRNGFITIAGQTAPGDGITLAGWPLNIWSQHVIVRYIRSRPGDNEGGEPDAIWVRGGNNIMIDHVSASWSVDETLSVTHDSKNVTVQWSIISESLHDSVHSKGPHGMGSLINGHSGASFTFHHNLYAHHDLRSPRPGGFKPRAEDPDGMLLDFRNNVIYNWDGGSAGYNDDTDKVSKYNFINNYYKTGPDSDGSKAFRQRSDDHSQAYFAGNAMNGSVPGDPWSLVIGETGGNFKRSSAFKVEPVTTESAADAYKSVLADAGASKSRDSVDRRIVNDVRNGTGRIIDDEADVGGWPTLNSTPPPADADGDGMPDYWEINRSLNPNKAFDRNGDRDEDGYTNLEEYINDMPGAVWDGGSSDGSKWGQEANWDHDTQPSWGNTAHLTWYTGSARRLTSWLGAARTVKSITFNDHVDANVNIGLRESSSGDARRLIFSADAGKARVTVDSGAAGNITFGHTAHGKVWLASDLVITHNGSGILKFGRPIYEDTVNCAITKKGTGTLILSGNNTYSGGTTLGEGNNESSNHTQVGHNSALGTGPIEFLGARLSSNGSAARTLANDITFGPGGGTSAYLGDATNNGKLTFIGPVNLAGGTRSLQVDSAVEIAGAISDGAGDDGAIRKKGAGTLVLSGTTTFSGGVTVEDGELVLAGAGAYAGSTAVSGGILTVSSSLAHANIIIDGGLVRGSGSLTYNLDDDVHDLIAMSGGEIVLADLELVLNITGTQTETKYLIIDNAAGGAITGTFGDVLNLPSGWSVDYTDPAGVALLPEPATLALLAAGGLGLAGLRRRAR